MNILNDYYSPDVLSDEHKFSESGIYHQLPLTADHEVYLIAALVCEHPASSLLKGLPLNQ